MQSNTYLQSSLKNGKIIRWLDKSFPLKIYIAPFRWYKANGQDYLYIGLVRQALKEWSDVSNGKIRFEEVDELRNSQINLDWKRIDRQALGNCTFMFDNQNRLYSAELQIGLSDGYISKKYMNKDEVYHTILHEIGHALGLGHSPYETDIMFTPHKYGIIRLSKNDTSSINWLYKLPYGSSPEELAKKYNIPETNIDKLVKKLSDLNIKSEFEQVKESIILPQKNLLQEQVNIAELKKYNLLLQNIKISDKFGKYIQQTRLDNQQNNEEL